MTIKRSSTREAVKCASLTRRACQRQGDIDNKGGWLRGKSEVERGGGNLDSGGGTLNREFGIVDFTLKTTKQNHRLQRFCPGKILPEKNY
jgi:hypothetical protein